MPINRVQCLAPEWVATFAPDCEGRRAHFAIDGPPSLMACSGTVTAIFDGIFWNRDELVESLAVPTNESDSSIIVHAWLRWGERLLSRIKGIFAVVVWDRDAGSVLCARDPIGHYPLFYAEAEGELLFSTSITALLHQGSVPHALNRSALADLLLKRCLHPIETFYSNIKRVLPGHALKIDSGTPRSYRYWDPAPPDESIKWIREDELGRFDDLLVQAVRRCLSTGPVGIYLSGGLDSVSVAAAAAANSGGLGLPPPLALSLAFPDTNEDVVQRAVAARLGLVQHLTAFDTAIGPNGWFPAALEISSRLPAPLLNVWMPAYTYLAGYAERAGCTAILTGTGGDEWLGVSPVVAADLIRSLDLRGLLRLWRAQCRSYHIPMLTHAGVFWNYGVRPVLRSAVLGAPGGQRLKQMVSEVRHRSSDFPAWVAPESRLRADLRARQCAAVQVAEAEQRRFDSYYAYDVHRSLELNVACWEIEEHFLWASQIGMRFLHPYLDADLIDFLYRTPPQLLNRGGRSKGVVRDYLARACPNLGLERQKKFSARNFFYSRAFREAARNLAWFRQRSALAELGVVDGAQLQALVEQAVATGKVDQALDLWNVFNLEAWVRSRQ